MILISGEALVDLIPDPDKDARYDAVLGGSPYNVAIGLARLGAPTAFISRISNDANGEKLAAALDLAGADLALAVRDPRPSTLAFVMRGTAQTGSRYSFYLDAHRLMEFGRFPRPGRKAPGICTSARSPRSNRDTEKGSSRRSRARAPERRQVSIPTSARSSRRTEPASWRWSSGRLRLRASSRPARKISSGYTPAARWRIRSAIGRVAARNSVSRP